MYWYLERPEDRPVAYLQKVRELDLDGGLDRMDDKDGQALYKQALIWSQAKGKNFYLPNLKERIYLLMPHKTRAISGANRSGKSATNIIDMVSQAEGWNPLQRENLEKLVTEAYDDWVKRWCEYVLKNKKWITSAPVEMRIVAPEFGVVEKAIGPEVVKWATMADLDPNGVRFDNDKKRDVLWKNKSFIEFLTTAQDLQSHMGVARHKVYFDEECPKDYWMENLLRTASVSGKLQYGATAVNGVTWTEDDIFQRAEWVDDYIKDMIKKDVLKEPETGIFAMEMTIWDNPMNTDESIDEIKEQCTNDMDVQIKLYGKRVLRGGQVFHMAKDEEPWVIPSFVLPENGVLIMAIDPHPKIEHALLWAWVDFIGGVPLGDGRYTLDLIEGKPNLYEIAESFEHGTIPQLAKDVEKVEGKIGRKHDIALCDPAAWVEDQTRHEKSLSSQLVDAGIFPIKGSKELTGGIKKTQELLTIEDVFRLHKLDHPRLMTFFDLLRVRWEAKSYRWQQRKGKHTEDMSDPQKPVDKDDHMMENRRRICEYVIDYESEVLEFADKPPRLVNMHGEEIDVDFDDDEEGEDMYEV